MKKILAAASRSFPPVNQNPLHTVSGKAKRRITLYIAVLQQHGSRSLRQSFVAKLIELVPSPMIQPLLLIAL